MSHYRTNGFTIIETTLVMAITGLVAVTILAGIGSSLAHQRYTDAVNQTVSFFKSQYSRVSNISNERPSEQMCTSAGISSTGSGSERGASDCLLLGHVVRSADGKTLSIYQVIGRRDPSRDVDVSAKTATQILSTSSLIQGDKVDEYTIDWDSRLLNPNTANAAAFSVMIVRVPVNGVVTTYASGSSSTSVGSLLSTTQSDKKLCIDQAGFFGIGVKPMGVLIKKASSNTASVQTIASGDCV